VTSLVDLCGPAREGLGARACGGTTARMHQFSLLIARLLQKSKEPYKSKASLSTSFPRGVNVLRLSSASASPQKYISFSCYSLSVPRASIHFAPAASVTGGLFRPQSLLAACITKAKIEGEDCSGWLPQCEARAAQIISRTRAGGRSNPLHSLPPQLLAACARHVAARGQTLTTDSLKANEISGAD